jgi:hypothetical protein
MCDVRPPCFTKSGLCRTATRPSCSGQHTSRLGWTSHHSAPLVHKVAGGSQRGRSLGTGRRTGGAIHQPAIASPMTGNVVPRFRRCVDRPFLRGATTMMTTAHGAARTCGRITRAGAPCQMRPLANDPHCWNHSVRVSAEREAARRRGGRNRRTAGGSPPLDTSIRSLRAIQGQIEAVLRATWAQENSYRRSISLAGLLGLALKVRGLPTYEDRVAVLNDRLFGVG